MCRIFSLYQTQATSRATGVFPWRLDKLSECCLCKIALEFTGHLVGEEIWWSFQSVSKSELAVTVGAFLAHGEICSTYLVTTDRSPSPPVSVHTNGKVYPECVARIFSLQLKSHYYSQTALR